jgi:hypothetical protein
MIGAFARLLTPLLGPVTLLRHRAGHRGLRIEMAVGVENAEYSPELLKRLGEPKLDLTLPL